MKYLLSTFLLIAGLSGYSQDTQPPPPTPPPPIPSEEVYKVVEEMPRFPGCENQKLEKIELKECSQDKMLAYIYDNLVYPPSAKANKVESMSVIQLEL
jgi:protein TonB